MAAIVAVTFLFILAVTENHAPCRIAAPTSAHPKYAESARTITCPATPAAFAVVIAWAQASRA